MKRFYLATVIAVVITTSIASHLFAVGVLGSTAPGILGGLRSAVRELFGRLKNGFDNWVAAMLARREHQATAFALGHLTDRELNDIGIYRGDDVRHLALNGSERTRQADVCEKASAFHTANVRL